MTDLSGQAGMLLLPQYCLYPSQCYMLQRQLPSLMREDHWSRVACLYSRIFKATCFSMLHASLTKEGHWSRGACLYSRIFNATCFPHEGRPLAEGSLPMCSSLPPSSQDVSEGVQGLVLSVTQHGLGWMESSLPCLVIILSWWFLEKYWVS